MGSYSYLRVGEIPVHSTKRGVDPSVLMLFTEDDKRIGLVDISDGDSPDPEQDRLTDDVDRLEGEDLYVTLEYVASAAVVKDRLDFMGFTLNAVREEFKKGTENCLSSLEHRFSGSNWPEIEWARELQEREHALLKHLTLQEWLNAFGYIYREKLCLDPSYWHLRRATDDHLPAVVRFLLGNTFSEGIWFPSYDFRFTMRAIIEVIEPTDTVAYSLSELLDEYVDMEEDLCGWARRQTADESLLNHKVIVLTEGSTDKWAIEGSLRALYPHLTEYYSFMDFEGVRAPGGAGALVATIKAFVGAGIANRFIAIFDNDTAAQSALRGLRDISLPATVRVLRYPDVDWARSYPTLGPQGVFAMNVNGLAGSLELYFGLDVLRQEDGTLAPVQWRGFDDVLRQYQGELTNKSILQARFADKLKRCENDRTTLHLYDWRGMYAIVEALRTAFHDD